MLFDLVSWFNKNLDDILNIIMFESFLNIICINISEIKQKII
jgi:hypothetical protein